MALEPHPLWWQSRRVHLALVGCFGFLCVYLLRVNFSVALACMTRPPLLSNRTVRTNITTGCQVQQADARRQENNEFDWSKQTQGYLLSSFFYGYIVTQVPSGWLSSKLGGKHVMGVGMVTMTLASLLIPVAARQNVALVMALRVVMGLAQGVTFPAMHTLWGKWAPPLERTKLISFCYAGTIVGVVLALGASGFLCDVKLDNGWPLLFYIYGAISLLWCFVWYKMAADSPEKHASISPAEVAFIETSIGHAQTQKVKRIPWRSIFTSRAVWAIVVAHTCNNWGSYTIITCIPLYMKEVLLFDIKHNGVLSAVPYVVMFTVSVAGGQAADLIRSRRLATTITVRKAYQVTAFLASSVFIIAVGYMDCSSRSWAVVALTLAVAFTALGRSGYSVNHVDIAPRYAGVLFSISNTAATVPGMVSPVVMGALTPNGLQSEWQRVFFICGGVYAFGALVYGLLAEGEEQNWAKELDEDFADKMAMKQNDETD